MRHQSPIKVFLLTLVTFGIYSLFWTARTRGEMVRQGADIPTTWLIIIPIINIWYYWKWSEGAERVTGGKMQTVIAFILMILLGGIGMAIVQNSFNELPEGGSNSPAVASPINPTVPSSPVSPAPLAPTDSTTVVTQPPTAPPATSV